MGPLLSLAGVRLSSMPRIVIKEHDSDKALEVAETEATLGRDPACGFFIEGPQSKVVSARHARIFFQDGAWWIEDSSRNGTTLDDERLQRGQRHALKVGQIIGLGESGPRYRVAILESRKVAETVLEHPDLDVPAPASPPAPPPVAPPVVDARTAALRYSEAMRAGLNFQEKTEPSETSPDWQVHIVLRATNTNQRFEARAQRVTLGRANECSVQVPPEYGASVSRVHAEISIREGGIMLRDAGSRNGTFVNGKRLEASHAAARNDQIALGSGGPTYTIEELRIVKDAAPDTGSSSGAPPSGARPVGGTSAFVRGGVSAESPTAPSPGKPSEGPTGPAKRLASRSFAGKGRTSFFRNVLENMSRSSARRIRVIVWSSVLATTVVAAALLGIMQWRLSATERRSAAERSRFDARSDSVRQMATTEAAQLRATFDSARLASAPRAVVDSLRDALAEAARRTGVLELALARARQSLDQQLALGDSARRHAENEMTRLRTEVGRAQSADAGSRSALDSLRRALRSAEERANDVASQVRAVRGANLAQVAQLNQGAVGLLVWFAGAKVTSGSGFAITPSGYFVTNRHVVTDDSGRVRDSIYVTMADQKFTLNTRVQVVALGAGDVDIAVVKIPDYRGPYMKNVDWNSGRAIQGEPAALIGFPYGVDLAFDDTSSNLVRTSMSAGIFSKVAPERIQFDGFSIGGSSGSPVFNAAGEVVAVHRSGLKSGPGLGFAIPVSRVITLLPADAKNELGMR